MQGLPINFIASKAGQKNVQNEGVNQSKAPGQNVKGQEGDDVFAALLNQLTGNIKDAPIDGKVSQKGETDQNELVQTLLANADKNGIHFTQADVKSAVKLASANTNLDELIQSLKNPSSEASFSPEEFESAKLNLKQLKSGQIDPAQIEGGEEVYTDEVETKLASPLDFLIKETKPKSGNETSLNMKGEKNPEVLKGFVSSEDFVGLKKEQKDISTLKNNVGESDKVSNLELSSLFKKNIVSNPYAASKTGVLNDGLIKTTRDLAFGEKKSKIGVDELKSPELKVASDLSLVKESFIPNVTAVNGNNNNNNMEVANGQNVLDLSKINSANTNEIIKNISNYIEQNQVMNKDSLDLNVHHEELGNFKIQVSRNQSDNKNMMDMQIVTTTAEGHEFFAKNEISLMKTLSQAGIQLQDFKIVAGSESSNLAQSDSRQNNQSQGQGQSNQKDFSGMNQDRNNGSERRKELWEEARGYQRFGA